MLSAAAAVPVPAPPPTRLHSPLPGFCGQCHCACSSKPTLEQDKQDTTNPATPPPGRKKKEQPPLTCRHLSWPSLAHTKWLMLTVTSCMKGVPGVSAVLEVNDPGRRRLLLPPPWPLLLLPWPPPFLRSSDTKDFCFMGDGRGEGVGARSTAQRAQAGSVARD